MDKQPENEQQTAKLWKSTIAKLALLRGYTREPAVSIVDRLVTEELKRIEKERKALAEREGIKEVT